MKQLKRAQKISSLHGQRGAVLIVSLIILLVLTLLAVSTLDSTTQEMRMATNNQIRQQVFQAAEATLRAAENHIELNMGFTDSMAKDCVSGTAGCFDDVCEGGICFEGAYSALDSRFSCTPDNTSPPPEQVWRRGALDVWNTDSKHIEVAVDGFDEDTKYIIEFLCFVESGDGTPFDGSLAFRDNGVPLFRITALAENKNSGGDVTAQVMLQSTYRFNNL